MDRKRSSAVFCVLDKLYEGAEAKHPEREEKREDIFKVKSFQSIEYQVRRAREEDRVKARGAALRDEAAGGRCFAKRRSGAKQRSGAKKGRASCEALPVMLDEWAV